MMNIVNTCSYIHLNYTLQATEVTNITIYQPFQTYQRLQKNLVDQYCHQQMLSVRYTTVQTPHIGSYHCVSHRHLYCKHKHTHAPDCMQTATYKCTTEVYCQTRKSSSFISLYTATLQNSLLSKKYLRDTRSERYRLMPNTSSYSVVLSPFYTTIIKFIYKLTLNMLDNIPLHF